MYKIALRFRRFERFSFAECLQARGIYVFWIAGRWGRRPSYLGEGVLLERIAAHLKEKVGGGQIAHGCFARIDETPAKTRADCKIAEAALLLVADGIRRFPHMNKAMGSFRPKALRLLRQGHLVVRVTVSGEDPLDGFETISRQRVIRLHLRELQRGEPFVEHNWERAPR